MIIDTKQVQALLDNENISTNQIQDITGFDRKNVWMYRSGRTQLMKMQLQTLIKLQKCYNLTHDNLMKYRNFQQVIDSFNLRFGQTEIFIDPDTNELKILYDGIVGEVNEDDLLVVNKEMTKTLDTNNLLKYLEK